MPTRASWPSPRSRAGCSTETCRCAQYPIRHQFVPECVVLSPKTLPKVAYWMPSTCAYRLLYDGQPLPDWHPLLTGDRKRAQGRHVGARLDHARVHGGRGRLGRLHHRGSLMQFTSDNAAAAAPEIMAAVAAANTGVAPSYGADPWCARATDLVRAAFGESPRPRSIWSRPARRPMRWRWRRWCNAHRVAVRSPSATLVRHLALCFVAVT